MIEGQKIETTSFMNGLFIVLMVTSCRATSFTETCLRFCLQINVGMVER